MPDLLSEITQAARAYYGQWPRITVTETDFQDWLRELPPRAQNRAAAAGFARACTTRAFQRFCLEWRGFSMRELMCQQVSAAAFILWQAHGEFNGDLPADDS